MRRRRRETRPGGRSTTARSFLVAGTLISGVLVTAAPPAWRAQLDGGRWIGFLPGFVLAAGWLRGAPEPAAVATPAT